MMNDSHQATAKASGIRLFVKKFLVQLFNTAVVAGRPQRRYFSSIGMSGNKIFSPYDVVDNEYFKPPNLDTLHINKLNEIHKLKLAPFFLNISRHVPKKNISLIIKSYQMFSTLIHCHPWENWYCLSSISLRSSEGTMDAMVCI